MIKILDQDIRLKSCQLRRNKKSCLHLRLNEFRDFLFTKRQDPVFDFFYHGNIFPLRQSTYGPRPHLVLELYILLLSFLLCLPIPLLLVFMTDYK